MTLRRLAVNTAIVLGTLAVLFVLWQFNEALILFVFSLAVAAATRPYVEKLTERGMHRSQALILVYALFLGLLAVILLAVGSSLLNELQQLSDNLARTYDRIWSEWPEGTEFQRMIVRQLPAPADLYESFSLERQNSSLQGLLGFTMISAGFLGQFFTVLILSLYWSIDQVHFERLWLSLLPVESRARSRDVWRYIERDFGAYIRSEVLQSILASILLWVGLWLMGVRYPALLAAFGALAWLIPWLGGVLVVLPVTLTALSHSVGLGILASAYAIGVLFFLEFYVEPRFIRSHQYSSLLSILMILVLVEPFGLMGFIVAPPLAAAIELIYRYNLQSRQQSFTIESVQRISELRNRIGVVREMISNSGDNVEPQTISMLQRLETLINRADEVLDKEQPNRKTVVKPPT